MTIHERMPDICVFGRLDGMHFTAPSNGNQRVQYTGGHYVATDEKAKCGCRVWMWRADDTETAPLPL